MTSVIVPSARANMSNQRGEHMTSASVVTDFDSAWVEIERDGLDVAFEVAASGKKLKVRGAQFVPLYTKIYGMCVQQPPHNWSGKLYYALSDTLERRCINFIKPLVEAQPDTAILSEFLRAWDKYQAVMHWCGAAFKYLDRFYVCRLALPSIHAVGILQFRANVFKPLLGRIVSRFVQRVKEERTLGTCLPETDMLRRVGQVFIDVGLGSNKLYRSELEAPLLAAAAQQLIGMSEAWLRGSTCPVYLNLVESQLALEADRVKRYLHSGTCSKLETVCMLQLVETKKEELVNHLLSGCAQMLVQQDREALARLFRLLRDVSGGIALIAKQFKQYILIEGEQHMSTIWTESTGPKKRLATGPLTELVAWYAQCRFIVKACFQDHHGLFRALKDSFEQVLNANAPVNDASLHIPEILCEYLDKLLRAGGTQSQTLCGDTEPLKHIELVTDLFSFINNKDMFAESYRKKLAKRLLLDKSASQELERAVVENLRRISGAPYVSKFAGIIKDVALATDLQSAYNAYLAETHSAADRLCFDMSVRVLTSGFWPTYKEDTIELPPDFSRGVQAFRDFYGARTAHRTLRWVHSLGTVTLIAHINEARYDLVLNTFQACALLVFNNLPDFVNNDGNEQRTLTLQALSDRLNVPYNQVSKHVVSLCFGKFKLLTSDAHAITNVTPHTVFQVNRSFADRSRRIKVPLLATAKNEDKQRDMQQSEQQVNHERKFVVEASIVRVMKAERRLQHEQLVNKIVIRLKNHFKVDPSLVRARVYDLVDRDYLELDTADPSTYLYVA